MQLSDQFAATYQKLVHLLASCRRLTVLTGAGCSTASGIPDYRDRTGAWKRAQPIQYQAFMDSEKARQRYWSRSMLGWRFFHEALPGEAHQRLAELQLSGLIHTLVTQNVDGLHQKAGSREVVELHGGLDRVKCLQCGSRHRRRALQRTMENENPRWMSLAGRVAPDGDMDIEVEEDTPFRIPSCEACGGTLKPDVVFFGESVPRDRVERVARAVQESDALLVVGSSLMVFSGWRFVRQAHRESVPVAIINQGVTRGDPQAQIKVEADCGQTLSRVVQQLNNDRESTD